MSIRIGVSLALVLAAAAKGRYILSITLTSTMGPGSRFDSSRVRESEILSGAEAAGAEAEPAVA